MPATHANPSSLVHQRGNFRLPNLCGSPYATYTENRQVACLVPKLQTIEINPANDDFDSQNFANVVESRWKWEDTVEEASDRVERIHKVTILCVDSYHVHSWMIQLKGLRDCAEEGLGVYVEAVDSGDIHSLLTYPHSLSGSASE